MNLLGFTGTRGTAPHEDRLREYFGGGAMHIFLSNYDGYVTGGCIGFDALIGRFLATKYPDKEHVVIVPADRSRVDPWWEEFDLGTITVIEMPDDTDYRARNEEIVNKSTALFYCAEHLEDHNKSRRSGTWMTVRIAQRAAKPVHGVVLNTLEVVK
jgi:hypothetical protein